MSEVLDRTSTPAPFWRSEVLARHGTAPALLAGDEQVGYAELARRVRREAAAWPGAGVRRLVLVEIEPTVDSVVTYLAALDAGHVVLLAAPGRADALAQVWAPDDRAHRRDRGVGGRPRVRARSARPAPRPVAAALDVGQHRLAQAGPPLRAGRTSQRRRHRHLARPPRRRPGGHDPAAALLLRPVRAALAPRGGRVGAAHRRLRGRPDPVELDAFGGGDLAGRRAAHLRAARDQRRAHR